MHEARGTSQITHSREEYISVSRMMGCGERDKSNHTFRRSVSWDEEKDGVWREEQVKSHIQEKHKSG